MTESNKEGVRRRNILRNDIDLVVRRMKIQKQYQRFNCEECLVGDVHFNGHKFTVFGKDENVIRGTMREKIWKAAHAKNLRGAGRRKSEPTP